MLRVLLLGDMEIFSGERRLTAFPSRKANLIFAYMILTPGRLYERAYLASRFWEDLSDGRARKALNTELWRIGSGLRKEGLDPDNYLVRRPDTVGIGRKAECWTDVGAFESGLKALSGLDPENCSEEHVKKVMEAVALYRGEFLEGSFDDWCLVRREGLIAHQCYALEFLMRYHMHYKDWQAALAYGNRLLILDPLMEHAHRALIRCHYLMGNRPAAIKQYAECKRLLSTELGVGPMEETEQVYQAMLLRRPSPAVNLHQRRASGNTPLQNVDLALANLHTATGWLEEASRNLKQDK